MRIALLAGLALTLTACGGSASSSDDGPDVGDKNSAAVMCQEFVKDRLKSPATADFETEDGVESGKAWMVNGVVDSENSFGAMMRNEFTCKVKYVGDDEWKLVDLAGLDN